MKTYQVLYGATVTIQVDAEDPASAGQQADEQIGAIIEAAERGLSVGTLTLNGGVPGCWEVLPSPEWVEVESSNIEAVKYDVMPSELYVRFKRKGEVPPSVYCYHGVPLNVFADLLAADSKGKFFAERIRNVFPVVRVE